MLYVTGGEHNWNDECLMTDDDAAKLAGMHRSYGIGHV